MMLAGLRLAFSPLQRQVVETIHLTVVVTAHDVGVADAGTVFRFAEKALHCNRVSGQTRAKNLDCRQTTLRVFGPIDGRRPTLADVPLEVISGDSPTDQGISVHEVAKLVNRSDTSKLNLTAKARA
jgi:hypothetical protein